MARPRMRPRFIVDVEADEETIISSLRDGLDATTPPLLGVFSPRHGVVRIPPSRRRFFTPQLDVLVQEAEQAPDVSRLVVRFAPHPPVWLAFVFTYAVLFALGLSGLMYAMAELSMGRAPLCLISTFVAMVVGAFVYGAAFIGQGLGANDMFELRNWLDQCLTEARERARQLAAKPGDSAQL